jgi:hypothetical protein
MKIALHLAVDSLADLNLILPQFFQNVSQTTGNFMVQSLPMLQQNGQK